MGVLERASSVPDSRLSEEPMLASVLSLTDEMLPRYTRLLFMVAGRGVRNRTGA